jgi:hypothetical protein
MASMQNQALQALPNVLHDQTVPNSLGGVTQPRPVARRRVPVRTLTTAAVVLAALVALLTRAV